MRELRAQMERLQNHIKELEARLAKLNAAARSSPRGTMGFSGFGGGAGFDRPDSAPAFGGRTTGGGFSPFGSAGGGFGGTSTFGRSSTGSTMRGPGTGGIVDPRQLPAEVRERMERQRAESQTRGSTVRVQGGIEERLDRILQELQSLRHELKSRR